jgi:hypothetical protein
MDLRRVGNLAVEKLLTKSRLVRPRKSTILFRRPSPAKKAAVGAIGLWRFDLSLANCYFDMHKSCDGPNPSFR